MMTGNSNLSPPLFPSPLMKCDVCAAKTASVFLTQIVKGDMQKINLCESCAKEKGVTDPTGFQLADMLLGFGAGARVETNPLEKSCPSCGMTQSTFRKTGRLGCSACYGIFGDGMEGLLKAMHKGTRHIGKVPACHSSRQAEEDRLAQLRSALDAAVASEAYEDAARLKTEIAAAEKALAKRVSV
jgi:protein arginine kinase activator